MAAARWRELGMVAPALLLWLAGASARAEPAALSVHVAGGGCPDAALLEQKLAPLLGGEIALEVTGGNGAGTGDDDSAELARVEDLGDAYAIEVDGLERELADPARDCVERARVAAVFIALNVREPVAPAPDEDEDEDLDAASPAPASEPRLQLGVRVQGEASYAAAIDRSAFGAGAGAWLEYDAFVFAVVAGALSTAEVGLAARDGIAGSVELTRFPFGASASYLLRAGPLAFGPTLGLGVDLLHLRGAGVERPQTELRVNPGGLAGADLHLQLASALSLFARFGVHAFPRAYDLSVDPAGRFASTPRVWLSLNLGIDARLR